MQANEWHEERNLRQQESIYLSKIQDGLLTMQAELARRITLFETSAQRMISALREFNGNIVNFRISLPVVDEIVWEHVNFSVDRDQGSQIAEFDMTEICQSRPMRNAVVEMIDLQRDSLSVARRAMQSVDQSLAALRRYSAGNGE